MTKIAEMIIQQRRSRGDKAARDNYGDGARDRAMRDSYADGFRDGFDQAAYHIQGEYDQADGARRRSRTTGRYMRDRGESLRLNEQDIAEWEKQLKNADGTHGAHFRAREVEEAARKMGIRFDEYNEDEFCMVMNMLYSDFCEATRPMISPDKEVHCYAKMAQAWLEDDDGPRPEEKLALYYYCIADQ